MLCSPLHLSPLQQEFLSLHNKLFHLPFTTVLLLCKLGVLPKRSVRNNLPLFASCMFGQAHRRPCRHKTLASNVGGTIRNSKLLVPGEKVCTDQLVSAQPGLVPQEKGSPTRACIWGATIFVDAATDWIKVCLMRDATGESTLDAKEVFERASPERGVVIKGYHADNGRYAEHIFKNDCHNKMQRLTFCGVGAHHQNDIAEAKIKQLTLTSRTMLLQAQRLWLEYISAML